MKVILKLNICLFDIRYFIYQIYKYFNNKYNIKQHNFDKLLKIKKLFINLIIYLFIYLNNK